mmetsp:Transcript_42027/g.70138  ORF Transcript_42027/g.70138 Transcript_42027/m.70138 type:complete len:119 (-) Transcript_42027:694-1050(-)
MGCFSSKREMERQELKRQCEDALMYTYGVSRQVLREACESLWNSTDVDTDGGIDTKELERAIRKIFHKWHAELHIQKPVCTKIVTTPHTEAFSHMSAQGCSCGNTHVKYTKFHFFLNQ